MIFFRGCKSKFMTAGLTAAFSETLVHRESFSTVISKCLNHVPSMPDPQSVKPTAVISQCVHVYWEVGNGPQIQSPRSCMMIAFRPQVAV